MKRNGCSRVTRLPRCFHQGARREQAASRVYQTACIAGLMIAGGVAARADENDQYGLIRTLKKTFLSVFFAGLALCSRAELTVFAAASTTDRMKEMAAAFQAQGGDGIRFNFAASGALARQIEAGAPAELFISAN